MTGLPIASSVGVEIEFHHARLGSIVHADLPSGWTAVRDGSCTTEQFRVGNIEVEDLPRNLYELGENVQVGGELVSPPFNRDLQPDRPFEDTIRVLRLLHDGGEHKVGTTTSVHVHVNVGKPPIYMVRNLLMWWERLEAVIYRLAVAEHDIHRGTVHGDYMYCRPLSGQGPQVVQDGKGDYRFCFDLEKVKGAKDWFEAIKAFGRADHQPTKWMPFRYYGLNLGTIYSKGTVEFRIFNQTLRAEYVKAWVELSQALVRAAYMDTHISQYPRFPLGHTNPEDGSEFGFQTLAMMLAPSLMSEHAWQVLESLFNETTWQPGVNDYQVNHLTRRERLVPLDRLPKRLQPAQVPQDVLDRAWANTETARADQPEDRAVRPQVRPQRAEVGRV